jgi:hypothetical protein
MSGVGSDGPCARDAMSIVSNKMSIVRVLVSPDREATVTTVQRLACPMR